MSTLDGKLARKHSNRFQPARDTTDPIIFPEEGEPSFRVKPVQARPVKRQRKRVETTVYADTRQLLDRIVDAIYLRGNRDITQSEIIERGIRAIAKEEGVA